MKKLFYILSFAAAGIFISGCGKDYLTSLQNNPNSVSGTAATPQLVLPGTLTSLGNMVNGDGAFQAEAAWMGYWNYSGGYSYNTNVHNYVMTTSSPSVLYGSFYSILANVNVIDKSASGVTNMHSYVAIAKILKAMCYQYLVDYYNDVPYTQSLQGIANFFPTYDKGSAIYDGTVSQLDTAINLLKAANGNVNETLVSSDDVMFGGDLTKWLKFANTVKLRALIRQSAVASKAAYIQTEIASTASVGYMGLGGDALVNPGYANTAGKQNPLYADFGLTPTGGLGGNFNYLRANGTGVAFFINTKDPRLAWVYCAKADQPTTTTYYSPSATPVLANYAGDTLGQQNLQPTKGSGFGPGIIKAPTQPLVMFSAAEALFLQAEAAYRGWITSGTAATFYNQGIQASFEFLGVGGSTAAADGYAATYSAQTVGVATNSTWPFAGIAYSSIPAGANQLQAILTQKWAALNSVSASEAYSDWRRTGYPVVPLSSSPSLTVTHKPYRYFYPTEEVNSNTAAWTAGGGATVDPFATKIFWMP